MSDWEVCGNASRRLSTRCSHCLRAVRAASAPAPACPCRHRAKIAEGLDLASFRGLLADADAATHSLPPTAGVGSKPGGGGPSRPRSACGVWGGPAHALLYRTSSL